jgi:hypothetical protein
VENKAERDRCLMNPFPQSTLGLFTNHLFRYFYRQIATAVHQQYMFFFLVLPESIPLGDKFSLFWAKLTLW